MQLYVCGKCLDKATLRQYGKCRLLNRKSDLAPDFCPFDPACKPKWEKSPHDYKVVKNPTHNTQSTKG